MDATLKAIIEQLLLDNRYIQQLTAERDALRQEVAELRREAVRLQAAEQERNFLISQYGWQINAEEAGGADLPKGQAP